MLRRFSSTPFLILISIAITTGLAQAAPESEPNDTVTSANQIISHELKTGAIDPIGDLDYFSFDGVNTTWGFIALLETDQSTSGQDGLLAALGSDGTTVLQSDMGSWHKGSGIALQNFANGTDTHYFQVGESGDDQDISAYTLRYYKTIVTSHPELESNETRLTGTPSSYTHEGVLSSNSDVDCFAFQGRLGDTILLALNGDPEGDSSPVNAVLELLDPNDLPLATADVSGLGGKEFIESDPLSSDGIYAYCVHVGSGTGGGDATYKVGLVRNGRLYVPDFVQGPSYLTPGPEDVAFVGDTLSFSLAISNTSPLQIPDYINLSTTYDPTCLQYLDANEIPTSIHSDRISWDKKKIDLAPGEEFSITMNFKALAECHGNIHQDTYVSYYFQGSGGDVSYTILPHFPWPMFLPAVTKGPKK